MVYDRSNCDARSDACTCIVVAPTATMSIDFLIPLTKEEKEILLLALGTSELVGEIELEWSTETEETTWNIDFNILREKLKNGIHVVQHQELLQLLLETGGREIREDSPYDDIWGYRDLGKGPGQNLLGKAWMAVRENVLIELHVNDEIEGRT